MSNREFPEIEKQRARARSLALGALKDLPPLRFSRAELSERRSYAVANGR